MSNPTPFIPDLVARSLVGRPWDQLTPEQQDQAFRDSIPHEEHLEEEYYMVGCTACDEEHALAYAAGTCQHCLVLGA